MIICWHCGIREVEGARRDYTTPTCFVCLPRRPPRPVPYIDREAIREWLRQPPLDTPEDREWRRLTLEVRP